MIPPRRRTFWEWIRNPFHIHQWVAASPDPEFMRYSDPVGSDTGWCDKRRNWACVLCGEVDLCLDRYIEQCQRDDEAKHLANAIVERTRRKNG